MEKLGRKWAMNDARKVDTLERVLNELWEEGVDIIPKNVIPRVSKTDQAWFKTAKVTDVIVEFAMSHKGMTPKRGAKEVNKNNTNKVSYAVMHYGKARHKACFEAFTVAVDALVKEKVALTPKAVFDRGNGAFSYTYYNANKEAKEYYQNALKGQKSEGIKVPVSRKEKTEEKIALAIKLIDEMLDADIPLTADNIAELSDGKLAKDFIFDHKKVHSYFNEKKKAQKKPVAKKMVKKSAVKKASCEKIAKTAEIKADKNETLDKNRELLAIEIEFVKSVIDYVASEEAKDSEITVDEIAELSGEFSVKEIAGCKELVLYISSKNDKLKESIQISKCLAVLEVMKKEKAPINLFTFKNRAKVDLAFIEAHKNVYDKVKEYQTIF